MPSKDVAENLFISPSAVSKSLKRSAESGLFLIANGEKRVNRSALMEFLSHGFKYVFPPAKGSLTRGVPAAAEPLKSRFLADGDPPEVWPYVERCEEFPSHLSTRALYEIPGFMVFSRSAMRFAVGELESETLPLNCSVRRSMPDPNFPLLEDAIHKIAPFLDEIVFVGSITLGLLTTDKAAAPIRGTNDVDVIAEIVTYADYVAFSERLREAHFTEDLGEKPLTCRWQF